MKVGTKSLLIGVHQILWHPFTVFIAWCELYGLPSWEETVCIFIHDWGYWGCSDMEGDGADHPRFGAELANRLFGLRVYPRVDNYPREPGTKTDFPVPSRYWFELCMFHSRGMAKKWGAEPSKLCWADKLSIKYDPWWLYLPRAIITGEIKELRRIAAELETIPETATNREWYEWARARMMDRAYTRNPMPPYDENNPDVHLVKS